jgi:hypothetical protein
MTAAIAKWITLDQAREITGHTSNAALTKWVQRWNAKHPEQRIQRRHGFLEFHSVNRALRKDHAEFDQDERVAAAVAQLGRRSARVYDLRRSA